MVTTYDQSTVTYDQSTLTYQGLPAQFDGVAFAVEMAFGYGPLNTSPSWESVTPYVRGFDTSRGRSSEFTRFSPGTASIRLDNRDRRFDPEYVSGPYFGELVPMVPVRIQATYSGVTYTMFRGFVLGWPTAYNVSNTDAVATIRCVDATRLLSNLLLDETAFRKQTRDDNATWYFPLQRLYDVGQYTVSDEYTGATRIFEASPYFRPTQYDTSVPVGASLANKAYVSWNVFPGGELALSLPTSGDMPNARTIELWVDTRIEDDTADQSLTVNFARDEPGRDLTFRLLSRWNHIAVQWEMYEIMYQSESDSVGVLYTTTTALPFSLGMNHLLMTVDSGALILYINGSAVLSLALGAYAYGSTFSYFAVATGASAPPGVSNIAVYETGLSAAQVSNHYNAGIGFTPELSSARLERVLDDAGWPTVWRDIETGVQQVGAYRPESLPVSRYFDQIDDAEQGALFVNADGNVEFQSRSTAETANVVALFDDAGVDLPFSSVAVDANTVDAIRNEVVVKYANGETVSSDAVSIAAFGQATEQLDARLVTDAAVAQSIGDNVLARAKDPRTRINSLIVNVRTDPTVLVPAVAGLELADDVVVSLTPTGVGDPLWRAVSVQGVSHSVGLSSWDVTLYLAPGPISTNGPLMILDDSVYGELDNNKLG